MGIRSDVGIALKKSVIETVEKNYPKAAKLLSEADEVLDDDEGKLYIFKYVKWYADSYVDIKELYAALKEESCDDYLIVEACHDYPESDEGNRGSWDDNPWNLYKAVSVELDYEGMDR